MKKSIIRFLLILASSYLGFALLSFTIMMVVAKWDGIEGFLLTVSFVATSIMYIVFIFDTFQLWKEGK
jgi:hypothetical protein